MLLLSVGMGFFPLFLFPKLHLLLSPRQAVVLCLHWPDGCRVVTHGFLGLVPGAVKSQRSGEVPFPLSLDSCTRLAQPQALGFAMHGLAKLLRLEQTDLTPDRPHPPCGFRADVLFGLSLSQCPDECGSCHHPPPQPALGGGLIWLMKGARVELGGGTGHTVGPGSGRR